MTDSLDNWDDYRFFLAVVEHGSFAGAARALGVSQPTVGRRIDQLEARLGLTLFENLPEGQRLSADAAPIVDIAMELRDRAAEIRRTAIGRQSSVSGEVRIACTRGIAEAWLAKRLAAFRAEHPEITTILLVSYDMADLGRREADIAIRFGAPAELDLVGRRLGAASCGLFASKDYLARAGRPRDAKDLNRHRLIGSAGATAAFLQNQRLAELMQHAKASVATDDVNVQIALARAGFGIISIPLYQASLYPDLERLEIPESETLLDLWLLTHKDVRSSARMRLALDYLYTAFQEDARLFHPGAA